MSNGRKKRGGFTLIELLVVIGVMGLLGVAGLGIFFRSLRGSSTSESIQELEQNAALTLNLMERHIRNARRVVEVEGEECPAIGSTIRVLGFDGFETEFSLINGQIASNSSPISVPSVNVSQLSFECVSAEGAPDQVLIFFEASFDTGEGLTGTRTYSSAVGLRNY